MVSRFDWSTLYMAHHNLSNLERACQKHFTFWHLRQSSIVPWLSQIIRASENICVSSDKDIVYSKWTKEDVSSNREARNRIVINHNRKRFVPQISIKWDVQYFLDFGTNRVYAQLYGFEFYKFYDYNRIRFASYVFCVHALIYPKFKLRFPGISI